MTIAEVSKKYNLTPDTIRYYEKIGLLPTVPRKENGIRDFNEEILLCLNFKLLLHKHTIKSGRSQYFVIRNNISNNRVCFIN